jgi:Chemotaxis phosphatase, CheZ
VFLEIGAITRLLHDTLKRLGVMPKLQETADGLPDARSRLNYPGRGGRPAHQPGVLSNGPARNEGGKPPAYRA